MWARVFADRNEAPAPEALVEHLRGAGYAAEARTDADELGWFHLELSSSAGNVTLDRYGADEGIRNDLNSWAAWLEIHGGAHAARLMQHLIGSQQIVTLRILHEIDDELRRLLHTVLRLIATATGGVYQLDGEGFFDAAGTLLVAEMEQTPE
jgi:hypothetical protein